MSVVFDGVQRAKNALGPLCADDIHTIVCCLATVLGVEQTFARDCLQRRHEVPFGSCHGPFCLLDCALKDLSVRHFEFLSVGRIGLDPRLVFSEVCASLLQLFVLLEKLNDASGESGKAGGQMRAKRASGSGPFHKEANALHFVFVFPRATGP